MSDVFQIMFDCELLHRSYDTLIIVFARQIIVHTSLINILDSLNNNKSGKSSGVDGISAEHLDIFFFSFYLC